MSRPNNSVTDDTAEDNDDFVNKGARVRQREDGSSNADGEDEKKTKKSRWSSNDTVAISSGLDDAGQKLAVANAQAIAAKLSQPNPEETENNESNENAEKTDSPTPEKPPVDLTQVNTEETVTNVLGQLYDDDDDEEEQDNAAQPVDLAPKQDTEEAGEADE